MIRLNPQQVLQLLDHWHERSETRQKRETRYVTLQCRLATLLQWGAFITGIAAVTGYVLLAANSASLLVVLPLAVISAVSLFLLFSYDLLWRASMKIASSWVALTGHRLSD